MADRKLALDMWAAGADVWDIMEATGYSCPQSVYASMRQMRLRGIKRAVTRNGNRGGGSKPWRRPRVVALKQAGLRNCMIAERLGCSREVINKLVWDARRLGELPPLENRHAA